MLSNANIAHKGYVVEDDTLLFITDDAADHIGIMELLLGMDEVKLYNWNDVSYVIRPTTGVIEELVENEKKDL